MELWLLLVEGNVVGGFVVEYFEVFSGISRLIRIKVLSKILNEEEVNVERVVYVKY